jgi:CubicO group peptidase (beta-lactamase class C family)
MFKLLLILISAAACAFAQPGRAIAEPYFRQLIDRGVVTGAYFAEVVHGAVVETTAFGDARPDSLWRAASTSKALTAVGIMRLVERGQLDLDVDVNQYLKTLKVPATKSRPITLRHLLNHSSGLDDPFVGSGFLAAAGEQARLATVMRNWLPARLYEPGDVRLYSNFGYGLAGAIIEDVTGKRYEEFMRFEVLEPLGMTHSTFQQPLPGESEQRIVPSIERKAFGATQRADIIYHRATSAGGLTTTLADLLCFVRFVQGGGSSDGHQILRPETLNRMLGEKANQSGDLESYGFGIGTRQGQRYWYAGGDLGGYHTVLLWFPEHDRALVTMAASASNVATWNLVPQIMQSWFGAEKQSAAVPITPFGDARESAARVAGTYRPVRYPHHDLGKTFTVTMDQSVRANADGSITYAGGRWIAVESLRFRNVTNGRELTFQEDSTGQIRFLNRESERIAWYQSGRAAIVFYFGFVLLSVFVLWRNRRSENARPLRWMAALILIHSVSWLGAALVADPQRLILGNPWYLSGALAFGTVVPLGWVFLVASTCWGFVRRSYPAAHRLSVVLTTLVLGLYIPFIAYWQLIALPGA